MEVEAKMEDVEEEYDNLYGPSSPRPSQNAEDISGSPAAGPTTINPEAATPGAPALQPPLDLDAEADAIYEEKDKSALADIEVKDGTVPEVATTHVSPDIGVPTAAIRPTYDATSHVMTGILSLPGEPAGGDKISDNNRDKEPYPPDAAPKPDNVVIQAERMPEISQLPDHAPCLNGDQGLSALPTGENPAPNQVEEDTAMGRVAEASMGSVAETGMGIDDVSLQDQEHVFPPDKGLCPDPPSPSSKEPATMKAPEDPEFLAAAEANKGNTEAEWQYDSSDMDTSDSDTDSDSSSSDDSDEDGGGYEMLDPATAAKILMAEEGGEDDDGQDKSNGKSGIRSKNEQAEQVVPKPDVTVTDNMRIVPLGLVDNIVENFVLVKAFTSGEYQVLEQGSVLCLQDRSVIGAVAETLGRVQEPLYSVAFTNRKEIEEAAVAHGVQIFYVEQHSTFVFTEPLKGLKGTDASNIHDEEVADHEIEFSDDEAEAAYKRAVKQAKRGGKGVSADVPNRGSGYHTSNTDRKIISYDDDEGDEMYPPLARPPELTGAPNGMYGAPPPPNQNRSRRTSFDRGRGRGGRGGRGRGNSGRGDRGGRGRGGFTNGHNSDQHRGPSHSFPDQHNHHSDPAPNDYSQAPAASVPFPPGQYPMNGAHPGPPPPMQNINYNQVQWPMQNQYQPPPPPGWSQNPPHHAPNPSWMQSLQQPHHLGTNGAQHHMSSTQAQASSTLGHVNPAFFGYQGHQQHHQHGVWPSQNPTGQYHADSGQGQNAAYQAALQQLEALRRQNGSQ